MNENEPLFYNITCPFGCGKTLTVTKGNGRDCLNHPVSECIRKQVWYIL